MIKLQLFMLHTTYAHQTEMDKKWMMFRRHTLHAQNRICQFLH